MKIYTDNPRVKYVQTTISPEDTKEEIDAVLREYGTYDIAWHWRPELQDVWVQFMIEEIIDNVPAKVLAKVVMPTLWDRGNPNARIQENKVEKVNIKVSMRTMFWYIKNQLIISFAMQSSRVAAFLPDLVAGNGRRFFDNMKNDLDRFKALDAPSESPVRQVEVIEPPKNQSRPPPIRFDQRGNRIE